MRLGSSSLMPGRLSASTGTGASNGPSGHGAGSPVSQLLPSAGPVEPSLLPVPPAVGSVEPAVVSALVDELEGGPSVVPAVPVVPGLPPSPAASK